jgi:hypothetical protein
MRKIYKYENSIVTVIMSENGITGDFKKATENFLRKVIKERSTNGNSNTTGDIYKK